MQSNNCARFPCYILLLFCERGHKIYSALLRADHDAVCKLMICGNISGDFLSEFRSWKCHLILRSFSLKAIDTVSVGQSCTNKKRRKVDQMHSKTLWSLEHGNWLVKLEALKRWEVHMEATIYIYVSTKSLA